jgi:hypothetical protein
MGTVIRIEQQALEELWAIARDLARCEQSLVAWLDRHAVTTEADA